jgi:predicted secreted protein
VNSDGKYLQPAVFDFTLSINQNVGIIKMNYNEILTLLRKDLNERPLTQMRLQNWEKTITWIVDGKNPITWISDGKQLNVQSPTKDADIILFLNSETLSKIYSKELPFFIALWATNQITFEGSFSDAYKLGYLFLSDKRSRKIVFLAHCFLNINPRFPEGAAYKGSSIPLVNTLLDSGVGIVQMPCAEFKFLGPEKALYGEIPAPTLRANFRSLAETVVDDIVAYKNSGFQIVGIIGMNPSPSCGVEITKGKETMMGTGRDTSEKNGNGLFIEELIAEANSRGLKDLPIFGFRRTLPGEEGIESRLRDLQSKIN